MAIPVNDSSERRKHSSEFLREEIEDLEKSSVHSWSSWLLGFAGMVLLFGLVAAVVWIGIRTYSAPNVRGNLASVKLLEPVGVLDHLPASFRWEPVPGSSSYLVTVRRLESDVPIVLRITSVPSWSASAEDLASFKPGSYRWVVEAQEADGRPVAWGDGDFEVKAGS